MVVETPWTVAGVTKLAQLLKPSMVSFVSAGWGYCWGSSRWKGLVLVKKSAMLCDSTSVSSDWFGSNSWSRKPEKESGHAVSHIYH